MNRSSPPRVESLESRVLLSAQPVGPAFQVNTRFVGTTDGPVAVADRQGNFVVAWITYDGSGPVAYERVTVRPYSAAGISRAGELFVSTVPATHEGGISLSMDGSGKFVVAWQDYVIGGDSDIFARRFGVDGAPVGDQLRVNSYTTRRQVEPRVAMDADGDFVVTWEDWDQGAVMARAFRADGSPVGEEFVVRYAASPPKPKVAVQGNGGFVVTWHEYGYDGDWEGIGARVYGADLLPRTGDFLVNSATSGGQFVADVAARADGGFVVTWEEFRDNSIPIDIYAREFDAAGVPQGDQFRVNPAELFHHSGGAVAMNPDGDYVVVWQKSPLDNAVPLGVFGQRFAHPPTVRASSFEFDSTPQRLIFTFSENVGASLSASDLELVNLTTGQTIDPATLTLNWDAATFTASFSFPGLPGGVLPDGRYRARLPAASVADPGQNPMTSDASLSFFFLGGDANHDARVDRNDLSILTANWQQFPRTFSQGDFNYDARVDARDLLILADNWQESLPPLLPEARKPWSLSQRSPFRPARG